LLLFLCHIFFGFDDDIASGNMAQAKRTVSCRFSAAAKAWTKKD
jgi:hypothetical protein